MNTITPLGSATNLGSATARAGGQPLGQKYFQSGEIFKASVIEAQGKDQFIIDIKGNHITAQSKASLSVGQTLQLQVVSTSPQIELKIVANTQHQFFGHSLTLISENIDLAGLVKTLQKAGTTALEGLNRATVVEAKGNDAFTLDIGGTRVAAQSTTQLSPGQTLQLQVVTTSPQIELKIASTAQQPFSGGSLTLIGDNNDLAGLVKTLQQAGTPSLDGFNKATVLEAKGNNIYTLDIGGTNVVAQSKTQLAPGQILQLQVATTSPHVELKIAPDTQSQLSSGSLTLMGEKSDLQGILKTLQPAGYSPFQNLSATTRAGLENFLSLQQNQLSGKDGGESLKQLIDKMGLNLEKLLAGGDTENSVNTLKAALLEIAHVFKEATDIAGTTHRLLGTIEVYQLAQMHMENAGNLIFPLPFPFLEQGYLIVEDYGQQKEGESGIQPPLRFSLHLTMAELGNLRIDFLQYEDGLYIRFNTESQEKSDFIESFSTDLQQAIADKPLLGLSFSDTATDPAAELIQKLLPHGSSMLDTKA
jgi:hypothetical protein